MPSTIKIRVIQAKDLPIMDRKSQLADTFVTIHFGDTKKLKTKTIPKSLSPVWQEDFRIEVHDDNRLQDDPVIFTYTILMWHHFQQPISFRVWDKDLYSSDDSIGVVYIDLNCLLLNNAPDRVAGWFPIFDTLEGYFIFALVS